MLVGGNPPTPWRTRRARIKNGYAKQSEANQESEEVRHYYSPEKRLERAGQDKYFLNKVRKALEGFGRPAGRVPGGRASQAGL